MNINRIKAAAFYLIFFLIVLLLVDPIVSYFEDRFSYFREHFYFVEGDYVYSGGLELYRTSADSELLFELIPESTAICIGCAHKMEPGFRDVRITIDSHGRRRTTNQPESHKKRIIFAGGSYTFGVTVPDELTLPSLVQGRLNSLFPNTYLVENLGLSAMVLSQVARAIDVDIQRYGPPDLVLIQDTNIDRRAFFYKEQCIKCHLEANPVLYEENFAPVPAGTLWEPIQFWLARNSAMYRLVYANTIRLIASTSASSSCRPNKHQERGCLIQKIWNDINSLSDRNGAEAMQRILRKYSGQTRFIFFDPTRIVACAEGSYEMAGNSISVCNSTLPAEYREVHPPSYVYRQFANSLLSALGGILK